MSDLFNTRVQDNTPIVVKVLDGNTFEEKMKLPNNVSVSYTKTLAGHGSFEINFTIKDPTIDSYVRQLQQPNSAIFGDKTPPVDIANILVGDYIDISDFAYEKNENYYLTAKQGIILVSQYRVVKNTIQVSISGLELRYELLNCIIESNFTNGYDVQNGAVETVIKNLVRNNRINNNRDTLMNDTRLNILTDFQRGINVSNSYRFQNLKETLEDLASVYNVGNAVWYDNGMINFDIVMPQNVVQVSYSRGDIGDVDISFNKGNEFTSLLSGGTGELENRLLVLNEINNALGFPISGIKRSKDFYNLNTEEDADVMSTQAQLRLEELKTNLAIEIQELYFDKEIEKDFFIGDMVEIDVSEIGYTLIVQLEEYTVEYEQNKPPKFSIKFGDPRIKENTKLRNKISYNY